MDTFYSHLLNLKINLQLYNFIVRPILCYASHIWIYYNATKIYELEKIPHRLLRILPYRSNNRMDTFCHDCTELTEKYKVCSIKSFHKYQDLLFFFKVLNNLINSPILISKIPINVPRRIFRYNGINFLINMPNYNLN